MGKYLVGKGFVSCCFECSVVGVAFDLLPVSEVENGDGLWRRGSCGASRALQGSGAPLRRGRPWCRPGLPLRSVSL